MAKMYPSFREEDQEMAHELEPVVIGPPAYASPDPKTNAGRLAPVDDHPHASELKAAGYGESAMGRTVSLSTSSDALPQKEAPPEDREEWTKAQWQDLADEYGLATSGNKAEVRERVEEYESNES